MSLAHLGHKHTSESKKKISESQYKTVYQFDLKGNFIKKWESQKEAAITLNINYQGINNCILGKTKSSNGFIWKKN